MLVDDWHRLHLAERRPSYAAEAVRALHYAFADALDDAAEDLDRTTVVRALDALTRRRKRKDGSNPERPKGAAMTGRTAAYGRAAFTWAIKRGVVGSNPFATLPITKTIARRERVLSDHEISEIWRAAGNAAAFPYGTIVRLLILTGQRRSEVAGMKWSEISDDLSVWTMLGERTKNGAVHVVPLSAAARDLLGGCLPPEMPMRQETSSRMGRLCFPAFSERPSVDGRRLRRRFAKATENSRAKDAPTARTTAASLVPWSLHDLRRTVATGLQRLGVRLEVTEAVLNHISGSRGGIAGVYQRHDWAVEKRAALDAWAEHVTAVIEGQPRAGNVVKLTR